MENNTTTTRPADYVRYRIGRFREAITATKDRRDRLSAFGTEFAALPYCEKYSIVRLLDKLELDPATREELCAEFGEVSDMLDEHQCLPGWPGKSQLLHELSLYADAYRAEVCHGHTLSSGDCCCGEYPWRVRISALISELSPVADLDGICRLVDALDHHHFAVSEPDGPAALETEKDITVVPTLPVVTERIGNPPACP